MKDSLKKIIIKFPYLYIALKKKNLKQIFANIKGYDTLKNSYFFDEIFYTKNAKNLNIFKLNPLLHYILFGYKENYNPSLEFDGQYYFNRYKHLEKADLNPLVHYILYGKKEGKYPNLEAERRVENEKIAEKNLKNLDLIEFPDNSPLISIIITTFNGINHLQRLFKNFEKNICYPNYEIIIVDNGSTDESIEYLKTLNLPINIIKNNKIKSSSFSNNKAFKIAKGDFLLFLSNTIETTYGWLNEMFQTSSRYNHEVSVGTTLVYPFTMNDKGKIERPKLKHRGIKFFEDEVLGFAPKNIKGKIFNKPALSEYKKSGMNGACLLIKKSIFEEIGMFDEKYFCEYEDVDLCLKMIKKGYENIYSPNAFLFHYEDLNQKKLDENLSQIYKNWSDKAYFQYKWEKFLIKKITEDKINKANIFSNPLNILFLVKNENTAKKVSKLIKDIKAYGWKVNIKIMNKDNIYEINHDVNVLISTVANYYPKMTNSGKYLVEIGLAIDNQDLWHENFFIKNYDFLLSNQKDFFKGEIPFCISPLNSKIIIEQIKMGFKHKNFKNIYEQIEKKDYIVDNGLKIHYIYSNKDLYQNQVKIGVFTGSSLKKNPTAYYCLRIFNILNKIAKNKEYKFFIYSIDDELEENFFNYKCFDIVIIQRPELNENIVKSIIDKCKKYNIKIIQESDDDLLSLPETHPSYQYILDKHNILKLVAKKSDMLVVSTDELKNRYLSYNNNIEVVKNYLIPSLSNSKGKLDYEKIKKERFNESKKKKLIKLGYFGTNTHKNDFLLIKDSIKNVVNKVKEKGIDLQLDILGIFKRDEINEDWINIYEDYISYESFFKYLKNFDWDIGIAPLVDDKFNAGKSEIKYIEYTALGIPSICSDVKPYNSAIQDGFNGFLAKTPEEWEEKLEKLVLNESLRDEIIKNAVNNIDENYLIDSRVEEWERILKELIK